MRVAASFVARGDDHVYAFLCRTDRLPRSAHLVEVNQTRPLDQSTRGGRGARRGRNHAQSFSNLAVFDGLDYRANIGRAKGQHMAMFIGANGDVDGEWVLRE